MNTIDEIKRPSKIEQEIALESHSILNTIIPLLQSEEAEIEIEETKEKLKLPIKALKLLSIILKAMGEGKPISIVPIATEITTQKAAEILGCSRPHIVKLLEEGKINFIKVGRHRRILYEDIIKYKTQMKLEQKRKIIEIMNFDEGIGMYDS